MRAEMEAVPGSSPLAEQQDASVVSVDHAMASEQTEVEERTGSLHLDEGSNEKYKDLYGEVLSEPTRYPYRSRLMIGAKPPPYDDFRRYALIPTSLTKQLQAAAFQSDGADVELDMSSLVQDVQGEEIFVISTLDSEGKPSLHHTAEKQRVWKLKAGLSEDEDYTYISEEGWNKVVAG